LRTVGEYIKANADTLEEFTIDYFTVLPFTNIGGMQRAIQTFGSEEQLIKTLDKMNNAVFTDEENGTVSEKHTNL